VLRSSLPFTLKVVERHPLSPQLFFPNSGERFLVCACPNLPDGTPDLASLQGFIGSCRQGIVWGAGVWHSFWDDTPQPGQQGYQPGSSSASSGLPSSALRRSMFCKPPSPPPPAITIPMEPSHGMGGHRWCHMEICSRAASTPPDPIPA
jgi:hypothetical protein